MKHYYINYPGVGEIEVSQKTVRQITKRYFGKDWKKVFSEFNSGKANWIKTETILLKMVNISDFDIHELEDALSLTEKGVVTRTELLGENVKIDDGFARWFDWGGESQPKTVSEWRFALAEWYFQKHTVR